MSTTLSICIPTRNRAACLRELLDSIAAQVTSEVEVVISDDGSTDKTSETVDSFRDRLPQLHYERVDPPLRYDRNVLHVVSRASGEFCWLFGDDDKMEPGGLASVLGTLRADPNLTGITTDRIAYDHTLKEQIYVRPLRQQTTRTFVDASEAFLQLLDRLGFLSCQVVNRARWNHVVGSENLEPYFTNYVQLYVIARMLIDGPRWEFFAERCVGFRSDNDSFRSLGNIGRLKMDVCGYEQIAGDVFGRDSQVYQQAMSEVAVTHARHHIINARRAGAPLSFYFESIGLCVSNYWRYLPFWLRTFPVLVMPRRVLFRLRRIYQARAARS